MKKLFVLLFVVFVLVGFGCNQAPATTKITQGDRINVISIETTIRPGDNLDSGHHFISKWDGWHAEPPYDEIIDNVSYIEESLYYKQLTVHWKNGKSSSWTQNYSISFK